jgi:hypothetical protein
MLKYNIMDSELLGFLDFLYIPAFLILENITFRKLDLVQSSGERETPTLLASLERANLNHWTYRLFLMT